MFHMKHKHKHFFEVLHSKFVLNFATTNTFGNRYNDNDRRRQGTDNLGDRDQFGGHVYNCVCLCGWCGCNFILRIHPGNWVTVLELLPNFPAHCGRPGVCQEILLLPSSSPEQWKI